MSVRAIGIFVLSYLLIIAGEHSPRKLDRPAVGLLGAVSMVVFGVLGRHEALAAIDFPTISLLLGMMIVIHYAGVSGLLNLLAGSLLRRGRSGLQLLLVVCLVSGILSALFINDTVCLLMTPLLLAAVRRARLNPEPYLLGLATSSNVGSVMTLTGNPQNILIGQSSAWTWGAFAIRMVPLGLICMAANFAVIALLYRSTVTRTQLVLDQPESAEQTPFQKKLAFKTIAVLAGLLTAFVCRLPLNISALVAAAVLLVWANRPSEETLGAVDWPLLLFFAGLFVIVEGVAKTQVASLRRLIPAFTNRPGTLGQIAWFSFGSLLGSNLFSNVPFVMLLRGAIRPLPQAPLLWLVLAMSSTFAGNLTMVGSVANLIVAQRARPDFRLSMWAFLKTGAPSTALTTAIGAALLWVYHLLHWV